METVIPEVLREWADRSGCRLCVLFGSSATGAQSVKGDVDLAVDFEPLPDADRRLRIVGELDRLVAPRSVDVVFLHPGTDPVLRFEIFKGGGAIFERTPGTFIRERVRALMLYEDALPFRKARRERLHRLVTERPVVP